MTRPAMDALFLRLTKLQLARPWTVIAVVFATAALAGVAALQLELRTSFGELLPQNKESVIVAERVNVHRGILI